MTDSYYRPGGPVFFFDYGEAALTQEEAAKYLAEYNGTSGVTELAKKYKGLAIAWEHRYFGLSLPFPLTFKNDTATDPFTCFKHKSECTHNPIGAPRSYKYLTIEQALEDVVYFAHQFCPPSYHDAKCHALSPSETAWIFIGSSYPGARAALARIRNPETFYASWSSSAPVQVSVDGSFYFDHIQSSLPPNCTKDVEAAVQYADSVLDGEMGENVFRRLQRLTYVAQVTGDDGLHAEYNISKADKRATYEIAKDLLYGLTLTQQELGPQYTTDIFCSLLQSYNPLDKPSGSMTPELRILSNRGTRLPTIHGMAADFNASIALDAYIYAYRTFNYDFAIETDDDAQSQPDYISDYATWNWLVNTEWGCYEGSNPNNISIVSRYFNYTAYQKYYSMQNRFYRFNTTRAFPAAPDVNVVLKYGGWNMNPSNTMFTDGEYDPWRAFSVMSEESSAPGRKPASKVPEYGQSVDNGDYFGVIYPGTTHAQDIRQLPLQPMDGRAPLQVGLELFGKALDKWLPCF